MCCCVLASIPARCRPTLPLKPSWFQTTAQYRSKMLYLLLGTYSPDSLQLYIYVLSNAFLQYCNTDSSSRANAGRHVGTHRHTQMDSTHANQVERFRLPAADEDATTCNHHASRRSSRHTSASAEKTESQGVA